MGIDDAIQAKFDELYAKLHNDHLRSEALALHKIALAERLNEHLGLEPITNPLVDQIRNTQQQ